LDKLEEGGPAAPFLPVAGASCSSPSMERPAHCFEQCMTSRFFSSVSHQFISKISGQTFGMNDAVEKA
jgi:hypothetical protein